jgi:hypothetical protein
MSLYSYRKIIDAVMNLPSASTGSIGKVGDPIEHVDGMDKILANVKYGDDVAPESCLEVLIIRSPFPRPHSS